MAIFQSQFALLKRQEDADSKRWWALLWAQKHLKHNGPAITTQITNTILAEQVCRDTAGPSDSLEVPRHRCVCRTLSPHFSKFSMKLNNYWALHGLGAQMTMCHMTSAKPLTSLALVLGWSQRLSTDVAVIPGGVNIVTFKAGPRWPTLWESGAEGWTEVHERGSNGSCEVIRIIFWCLRI